MTQKTTTIQIAGKEYPFFRTNRGQFDFEASAFTAKDIEAGKMGALLAFVYYHARAAAKRAQVGFPYSFTDFIDNTEPDVVECLVRIREDKAEAVEPQMEPTEGNA